MSFTPPFSRTAFVLILLAAPAMMAAAQGDKRIETKDEVQLAKPGMSKVETGKTSAIVSDQSKLADPAKRTLVTPSQKGKLKTPDQSKLTKPGKSNLAVTGGKVTFEDQTEFSESRSSQGFSTSDRSVLATENSRVGVTGGAFSASDSSEVSTSDQSTIGVEDE
ncbi:hypothetical protein WNY37_12235 [Henriciella sp. AS95]|uniref:hypothetical protein n=1 Tax=Henriciella sp. AS95 TaxID=3135782 RepID=UPI00317C62AB